ncbi:MAG: hypothetical protein ABSD59_10055 [Terracidiphilus sp.]|jgi:hypothetical protein
MEKMWFAVPAMAAALAIAPLANADSFTFAIDGTNFQSDFTFTASQIAGQPAGVDVITAVTGWFSDPDAGTVYLSANPATVISAGGAIAPNYATSPDGRFLYDNVLYTKATGNGILDWDGLLLSFTNGYELNLFSDAYTADDQGQATDQGYFYWSDNGVADSNNPIPMGGGAPASGDFSAPEPSSLVLFGSGLALLALSLFGAATRREKIGAAS